jgi:hypothetical protein
MMQVLLTSELTAWSKYNYVIPIEFTVAGQIGGSTLKRRTLSSRSCYGYGLAIAEGESQSQH